MLTLPATVLLAKTNAEMVLLITFILIWFTDRELLIRIRYRSQEVVREHIKNPHGCLVYYNKPWQFNIDAAFPAGVEFPNITDDQRTEMTDSQYKFTDHVLQALEKG